MDGKQKLQSLIERRRKKQTKLQKDGEHLNKIAEARNIFLKSQNITPVVYDQHDVYMTTIQKRFYELCKWPQLTPREFVNVNILNGNSPKELYLIRKSDEAKAADFQRALSTEYTNNVYDLVYCMKAGLICIAKSTKGWQRCRILKLHENSTTDALLFDIGIIERVSWHDLRIIKEKLANVKPMAIRCSLVNVITAQPIERFSIQHHQHFLQILKEQHDFYIFVNRANFMSSDIYLYYKSDDQFHCVNNIFPAHTLSDTGSSVDEEATSEAIVGNTSSSMSKSKSNSLVKSKSKSEEPIQDQARLESASDSIRTQDSSCETEQSDESPPMEQRQKMEQRPESLDHLIETCKVSKPENVIVKHVAGFDEIYICFTKYAEAFNRLRFDVQTYVENISNVEMESPSEKNLWQIGDYCLAVDPADGSGEWLRGKIVKILAPESCLVFLRDVGKTIECECKSLKEISKELQLVRDFTWKVKLASIKITKYCTTSMLNELLCGEIESHEEMAISAVGDNNGNSWGVILWGINKTCGALSAEQIEFININESLVKSGVATLTASFNGLTDMWSQANIVDKTLKSVDNDDEIIERMHFSSFDGPHMLPVLKIQKCKMVSDKRFDVKCWLPSERVQAKKFVAFPMYVSQKLIIYVLEASRKTVSDEIKEILEKKYRQKQLERKDSLEWKKEDACFARYDGDDRFYRATVRRVNYAKNTCVVRFIDFGNCETCSLDDLRKATMFGDIPVLTRQYQLYNIQSTSPDGLWSDHVRGFCTDLVVERHCDLTVIDDRHSSETEAILEVEYCHLDLLTKHKDLATALVSRGMAKYINKPNGETFSPISN